MVLECAESENEVVLNLKKIYVLQPLVLESTNKANTLRTLHSRRQHSCLCSVYRQLLLLCREHVRTLSSEVPILQLRNNLIEVSARLASTEQWQVQWNKYERARNRSWRL